MNLANMSYYLKFEFLLKYIHVIHISLNNVPPLNSVLFFEKAYSVSHNFIYPSEELCSKIALGKVGVSLPW